MPAGRGGYAEAREGRGVWTCSIAETCAIAHHSFRLDGVGRAVVARV